MAKPFSVPAGKDMSLTVTFKKTGRAGDEGERLYGAQLQKFVKDTSRGDLRYVLVHSLNLPRAARDRRPLTTDVDFIVASGDRMVIINAKYWSAAGIYWSIPLPPQEAIELFGRYQYTDGGKRLRNNLLGRTIAFRNLSPHVNEEWLASENDAMAVERYSERLAPYGIDVSGMVGFVETPTKPFQNVKLLRWPGGIRSFKAAESLVELRARLGPPKPVHQEITKLLNQMKRHPQIC